MKARELAADLVDGFREVRLEVPGMPRVVYPASVRDGLANIAGQARERAASFLVRVAYHVAPAAILVQRARTDPQVPRNVALALESDALTYAALDEVGSRHPDLYGPADAGYWPAWRDQPAEDTDEG